MKKKNNQKHHSITHMSLLNNLLCLCVCFVVLVINKWMLSVAWCVYSVGSICLPQQAVNTAGWYPTPRTSRPCLPTAKRFTYSYKNERWLEKYFTWSVLILIKPLIEKKKKDFLTEQGENIQAWTTQNAIATCGWTKMTAVLNSVHVMKSEWMGWKKATEMPINELQDADDGMLVVQLECWERFCCLCRAPPAGCYNFWVIRRRAAALKYYQRFYCNSIVI